MDQQLQLLEGLTDAFMIIDQSGQCLHCNQNASKLFNYATDKLSGLQLNDLLELPDTTLNEQLSRIPETQESAHFDGIAITASGSRIPVQIKLSVADWQNRQVILTLIEDITGRKELENQLHIFKRAFDSSKNGMIITDHRKPDNPIVHTNEAFLDMTGYSRDEIVGKNCRFLQNNDRDQEALKELRDSIDRGEACKVRIRNYRKNGEMFWNELSISPIKNNAGNVTHFVGIQNDITERVVTEKALEESERKFKALAEESLVGVYLIQDGVFKYVNPRLCEMVGYSRAELTDNFSPLKLVHPDDQDMVARKIEKRINHKTNSEHYIFRTQTINNEARQVEAYGSRTIYNDKPAVIGMLLDITEQREYQEQLKRNAELFGQLFKKAPVGLVMLDAEQNVLRVNDHFTEMFGYGEKELKGQKFDELIPDEQQKEEARELTRETLEGQTHQNETVRYRKDGTPVNVLIASSPVIVNGETIAIYGMYVDISKRIRAEEQMEQSLREKEVLLEEIHHRVKNNLAIITGLLELQSYNTESEELRSVLQDSQNRLQTMRIIHEQLYQFESLSDIQLDRYIDSLVETIQQTLATDVTGIEVNIDADPVSLEITRAVPCGLLLNELITNSYKHAFTEQQEGQIDVSIKNKNGKVELVVSDNGKGLPDDFSFDDSSSLGASLIQTLSQQLDATLDIQNNHGATFLIRFPV